MRQRLEYALVWLIVKFLGSLPRPLARAAAISLAWTIYFVHVRLRRVGLRNLQLAFPAIPVASGLESFVKSSLLWGGNWPTPPSRPTPGKCGEGGGL